MLECFEQEGPATSGGTQTSGSVRPAEFHSAVWRKEKRTECPLGAQAGGLCS